MSVKIEWLLQGGQIIHNRIQLEVDPALAAPLSGAACTLRTQVTDYHNYMWREEMRRTGFTVCMQEIKLLILKLELGSKFNSKRHNQCATSKELEDLHKYKMGKYFA